MATLKDIAKITGYSVATISRTLNEDETLKIPLSQKARIRKVAEELNYIKNVKTSKNKKIAVVSWYDINQEIEDPYYFYIRDGVHKVFQKTTSEVTYYFKEDSIPEHVKFNALIAIGKFSKTQIKHFELISDTICFVDSSPDFKKYSSVEIDFQDVIDQVTEFATENSFKKIGYIGSTETTTDGDEVIDQRTILFAEELKKKKLYSAELFYIGHFDTETGIEAINFFNDKKIVPEFIFCANDHIALGVLRQLNVLGYKIPDEVQVIGFNDIPFSKFSYPSLSTIRVEQTSMGEIAAKVVLDNLNNEDKLTKRIILPTTLILRESTKK